MDKPKKLCFVDVETTGLNRKKHEIIELAAIVVDPETWQVSDELELKIMPEHIETADDEALRINGFCPDKWRENASDPVPALEHIADLLEGKIMAGHNVPFDLGFLEESWDRKKIGFPRRDHHVLDTVSLAMPLYARGEIDNLSLGAVCHHLNIITDRLHRAMTDAWASLEIARHLMGKMVLVPSDSSVKRELTPQKNRLNYYQSGFLRITVDIS